MDEAADGGHTEAEVKLLLRRGDIRRLRKHPKLAAGFESAGKPVLLESVYFDDQSGTLRGEGISLRVRQIAERRLQTIKAFNGSASPLKRGEWETDVTDTRPDLSAAGGTPLQSKLQRLSGPLKPLFETRVARTEFPVLFEGSEILVALDEGKVHTGDAALPICELELELKQGKRADLLRLAEELERSVPLELSFTSKSARGYSLLGVGDEGFGRAKDVHLERGMSIADAFRSSAHDCLRHMIENRAGVARRDPEALHQIRIGIRRFQTAVVLFGNVLGGNGRKAIKRELRWLRAQTGPARDLDVFFREVMTPIRREHAKNAAVRDFYKHVQKRRSEAYAEMRKAIISERFRKFAIQAAVWIEAGDWRESVDALTRARQDAPIEIYAEERLTRLHRKVRKRGRKLRHADEETRHKLRVQGKKLRYSIEFLTDLARNKKSRKRAKSMTAALKAIQDNLGGLNDIAVRASLANEMAGKIAAKQSKADRDHVAELIAGHQRGQVDQLLAGAIAAFEDFSDLKPFWKPVAKSAMPAKGKKFVGNAAASRPRGESA